MKYTERQLNNLLEGIYAGDIDVDNLPKDLFNAVSNYLTSALGKIEGKISESMTRELTSNLQIFSGAKVYQSVREMSLLKDDETIKTFKEFSTEAERTFDQYYKQWAQAEYNTTIGQAQMIERWEQIENQKERLPFLKYSAVIDTQTSEICLPLDGICLPVNDSFWDSNSPLNHFNCRCTLEQLDEFDAVVTEQSKVDEATKEMDGKREDLFSSNPYKDRAIFNDTHPYFDIPKQDLGSVLELADQFIPANSIKEARGLFKTIVEENSVLKVDKVVFDSKLSLESVNLRLESLNDLLKEYNVAEGTGLANPTKITLRSTDSYYGAVTRSRNYRDGQWLSNINLGSKTDSVTNRLFLEGKTIERGKSAVDAINIEKATTVHEFAHVIAVDYDSGVNVKDFFGDLRKLMNEYREERLVLNKNSDLSGLYKISLGKYANTNINEFMAEGFTEYKLNSNPSKYAKKIGNLIDKYFKK
jgi:SPP1 gp7 family putative phage head morphogenesis protein